MAQRRTKTRRLLAHDARRELEVLLGCNWPGQGVAGVAECGVVRRVNHVAVFYHWADLDH